MRLFVVSALLATAQPPVAKDAILLTPVPATWNPSHTETLPSQSLALATDGNVNLILRYDKEWRVVFSYACGQPPSPKPANNAVWRAETAFAKSMADRDHIAFQSHLAADAVFFGTPTPLRGKAAVAEGWKRFYETKDAPFSWRPDHVQILKGGKLAISTGPVMDPTGKQTARFTSIWRKEPDGRWRVVFDKGCR